MDDVDKCVLEVNELLGTPDPAPSRNDASSPAAAILLVQKKHLDPTNELKRLFGPSPGENRR